MTERSKSRPASLVPKKTALAKKAGLLVDTVAIGSRGWSCQTVHYRQRWREVRGQKTNRNPSEAVQL